MLFPRTPPEDSGERGHIAEKEPGTKCAGPLRAEKKNQGGHGAEDKKNGSAQDPAQDGFGRLIPSHSSFPPSFSRACRVMLAPALTTRRISPAQKREP